jgi:ribosome-binding factor A
MQKSKPKSTNRVAKMNSLIQQVLSVAIREFLEGEPGLVTVSKVETSGDLKWAKVWISIVGGNDDSIFNILNRNIYDIQGELNSNLDTKMFPRISFHLDTAPRYAQHIDELIKHVHEEDEK